MLSISTMTWKFRKMSEIVIVRVPPVVHREVPPVETEFDDDESQESSSKRPKFPTWEEAVAGMIESNIKNHSRSPGRGGGGEVVVAAEAADEDPVNVQNQLITSSEFFTSFHGYFCR